MVPTAKRWPDSIGGGAQETTGIEHLSPIDQRPGRLLQYGGRASGRGVVAVAGATPANAIAAIDLAASTGSTLVGHGQRSLADRLQDSISVKDFDILGDATGDLGAVLQWIHDNKLGPNGGIIELPAATSHYPISTPVVFTKPVLLRGGVHRGCSIVCTTADLVCLSFANWFAVEGLEFTLIGAAATTGIAIKGLASSLGHNGSRIADCRITGGRIGVHHERANEFGIRNLLVGSYANCGVLLENAANSDEGDNHVSDTTFAGGATTAAIGLCIRDAGFYGTANKVNGVHGIGVLVEASSGDVGDINWHGGSLEGVSGSTFRVQTDHGKAITKLQVIGVQMSGNGKCHLDLAGQVDNVVAIGNVYNGSRRNTTAVRIGARARTGILGSSAFHTLGRAIEIDANGGGWTVGHDNRFAEDIVSIFSGPSGQVPSNPAAVSDIRLALGHYVETSSAADWTNVFSWKGMGEFRYQVGVLVQGVGLGAVYGSGHFLDAATIGVTQQLLPRDPLVDIRIVPGKSGVSLLQVKKHAAAGGVADVTVHLDLIGAPNAVIRM